MREWSRGIRRGRWRRGGRPRERRERWGRRGEARVERLGGSGGDLSEPDVEIVVHGDAGDEAIAELEESACGELIGLAGGRGETFVGDEVGAVDGEFGGGAGTGGVGHEDEVVEVFRVALVHAGHERAEGVAAGFGVALIDVVDDVVGEEGEHGFAVTGVEGGVVALERVEGGRIHGMGRGVRG